MKPADKDKILEETNGGLEIIKELYPESEKSGRFPHFKLDSRNEDTASANVFKKENLYKVRDHGSGQSYNALDLVMEKFGYDFPEACKWASQTFGIEGGTILNVPILEFKEATEDQAHGDMIFSYNDKLTVDELKVLGKVVTNDICKTYNLKSCKSFTQIKQYKDHDKFGNKKMQIITSSNERYPIFVLDQGDWQKIYQPLNVEKGFRFRYSGQKPANFVFGLEQLIATYDSFLEDQEDLPEGEKKKTKLDGVVLAGGDRDALNVASLNMPVIWLNSETAILDYAVYHKLREMCSNIYYIGDIDETGVKESIKLAKQFIDIKIVWLPKELKQFKYRGKPKKDFKDYVDHYCKKNIDWFEKDFKENVLGNALPLKFWESIYDPKKETTKYVFNNEAFYRFLNYYGFYRFEEDDRKEDYSFIRIEDNVVERVAPHRISEFPTDFLKNRKESIPLINFVHRTSQLGERSLVRIAPAEVEFKDHGVDFQYYFFKNKTWRITKEGTTELNHGDCDINVWKKNIIDHDVKLNKDPYFKITFNKGEYDIKILRNDNHFLNYLINTSRVHWAKLGNDPYLAMERKLNRFGNPDYDRQMFKINELRNAYRAKNRFVIDEEGLSASDIKDQKLHLINKLYVLGYLLHKEKVADKAWTPFAMDHDSQNSSKANGGTGKSVFFNTAIRIMLKTNETKTGRDKNLFENKHIMDGVTKDTDYLLFDDLDAGFPYNRIYKEVTGSMEVNPKNGTQYSVEFKDSPKIALTSNFAVDDSDSSTQRRILYTSFSDWYHHKTPRLSYEYKPRDDFGKMLFDEFNEDEFNDYFNLCSQTLSWYLGTDEKIDCPMESVNAKNKRQAIGEELFQVLEDFMLDKTDMFLHKEEIMMKINSKLGVVLGKYNSKGIAEKLELWCDHHNFVMNPEDLKLKKENRIRRKWKGKNVEFYYVQTKAELVDSTTPISTDIAWLGRAVNNGLTDDLNF